MPAPSTCATISILGCTKKSPRTSGRSESENVSASRRTWMCTTNVSVTTNAAASNHHGMESGAERRGRRKITDAYSVPVSRAMPPPRIHTGDGFPPLGGAARCPKVDSGCKDSALLDRSSSAQCIVRGWERLEHDGPGYGGSALRATGAIPGTRSIARRKGESCALAQASPSLHSWSSPPFPVDAGGHGVFRSPVWAHASRARHRDQQLPDPPVLRAAGAGEQHVVHVRYDAVHLLQRWPGRGRPARP